MSGGDENKGLSGIIVAVIGAAVIGGGSILIASILSAIIGVSDAPAPSIASRPASSDSSSRSEQQSEVIAPEGPTSLVQSDPSALDSVESKEYMISAAHPAAAQAGAQILAAGGSAVDAAIAAQMVLNLVEPQSSGIGGGGFMLHWDEEKRRLISYDGRETAPDGIKPDVFLNSDGTPKPFMDAVIGGSSVGVPGLLRMLELAHQEHGKLPWADLFEPAIALAEDGFPISPRLHQLIRNAKGLRDIEASRTYFYQSDGSPKAIGSILKNPAFAETLKIVAKEGADAFYDGPIAGDIVNAVRTTGHNPGALTRRDMALYEAKQRPNLCGRYRDRLVCGMGPPSSGGSTVLQTLGILNHFDIEDHLPGSVEAVTMIGEASALAFADRNRYVGDTDFVATPLSAMVGPAYLQDRARHVDLSTGPKEKKEPGLPGGKRAFAPSASHELPSTTHLSIVDSDGNAVSMTTSIETGFGSRLMVRGFLLNNQLTDFSWIAEKNGELAANRIQPGKRPRSSMSPTLVFDDDRDLEMVLGSPGGSRIIGYVLQTIVNTVDWRMGAQEALAQPHFVNRNAAMELEADTDISQLASDLESRGYDVSQRAMTSGLHMIMIGENGLSGGADPRREGVAVGEGQTLENLDDAFSFIK